MLHAAGTHVGGRSLPIVEGMWASDELNTQEFPVCAGTVSADIAHLSWRFHCPVRQDAASSIQRVPPLRTRRYSDSAAPGAERFKQYRSDRSFW